MVLQFLRKRDFLLYLTFHFIFSRKFSIVKVINRVNSVIISLSQMTLPRLLTFQVGSLALNLTNLLFWSYFYLLSLQLLSLLFESVIMLLSQFPLTFLQTCGGLPLFIAELSYYSCVDFFFLSAFSFTTIHKSQDCKGRGRGISLTPHYHFHPLHRHLDISRAITAESSPLHIGSNRTRTGNLWFPRASRQPLSYGFRDCLRDI